MSTFDEISYRLPAQKQNDNDRSGGSREAFSHVLYYMAEIATDEAAGSHDADYKSALLLLALEFSTRARGAL